MFQNDKFTILDKDLTYTDMSTVVFLKILNSHCGCNCICSLLSQNELESCDSSALKIILIQHLHRTSFKMIYDWWV